MRRVVKVSRIRIIITIIVVVLTTLLTGCTGKEPNEIAYVVALGIDSTDDDNYKITIQYANTTQISGGASESGGKFFFNHFYFFFHKLAFKKYRQISP